MVLGGTPSLLTLQVIEGRWRIYSRRKLKKNRGKRYLHGVKHSHQCSEAEANGEHGFHPNLQAEGPEINQRVYTEGLWAEQALYSITGAQRVKKMT